MRSRRSGTTRPSIGTRTTSSSCERRGTTRPGGTSSSPGRTVFRGCSTRRTFCAGTPTSATSPTCRTRSTPSSSRPARRGVRRTEANSSSSRPCPPAPGTRRDTSPEDTERAHAHVTSLLDAGRTVMVQPYLDAVDDYGETALMYFDGVYSHAIRKGQMLHPGQRTAPTRCTSRSRSPRARRPRRSARSPTRSLTRCRGRGGAALRAGRPHSGTGRCATARRARADRAVAVLQHGREPPSGSPSGSSAAR